MLITSESERIRTTRDNISITDQINIRIGFIKKKKKILIPDHLQIEAAGNHCPSKERKITIKNKNGETLDCMNSED